MHSGGVTRAFKLLPTGKRQNCLRLFIPRVVCNECGTVRQVTVPFAEERKSYTRALARYVLCLCQFIPLKYVAKLCVLSWDTVKQIHKEGLRRKFKRIKLKDVRQIAIDEVCIGRPRKFLTIVLDLDTGQVLHIGRGKGAGTLKGFWRRLSHSKAKIRAVCTDMASGYMSAVEQRLPEALLIIDHFHLVKYMNDKLTLLRRQLAREADDAGKELLKGTCWLLVTGRKKLEDEKNPRVADLVALDKALKANKPLYIAYYLNFGDKANMEKLWSGAKNKTLKGANTILAQDSKNNMIVYTRADILRKEESEEIKKFIKYWKKIKGSVKETLVFDCKFTKYSILEELSEDNILFITLRKRNKKLIEKALSVSKEKWQKITLPIPKIKYKKISVFEEKVILSDCTKPFRQIIIKDHGRAKPTFIITNNEELLLSQVIEVYAKRWRIENKFSELVSFFNLNALSSSLMIRIHFDILWTFIADTLYHIFAKDLRRHERHNAKTIFKKFINIPGKLIYDDKNFQIMMRKRSHTPILKSVDKLTKPIKVPWLDNKTVEIIWTP